MGNNKLKNEFKDVGYVGVIVPTDYDETDAHAKIVIRLVLLREPALARPVLLSIFQTSAGLHTGLD